MPNRTCRQAGAHIFLGQRVRSFYSIQIVVAVLVPGAGVSLLVVSHLSGR